MDCETLLKETREYYGIAEGQIAVDNVADLYLRAIQYGEMRRTGYRVAQGQLIARIAREKLYMRHKNQYATLQEYLKSAGLADSLVSELNSVGAVLVPFCDEHKIKIDEFLTANQWYKLREAIPALKRKIESGRVREVKAILRDVKRLSTRDAVRAKYRRSRPKMGNAAAIHCDEGLVLVAVLREDVDEDEMLARVSTALNLDTARNGMRKRLARILANALQVVINEGA